MRFLGKVAIVTGASRGIGRAIAEKLGKEGAKVVVHYTSQAALAEDTAATILAMGGDAFAFKADLRDLSQLKLLFIATLERFGRLDILVNNAGVWNWQPFATITAEDFDRMFSLNARAPLFAMQEAASILPDEGRIINISSWATIPSGIGTALYTGAKAALEQFTVSLAKELGPRGITVNSILPGFTNSESFAQESPEEYKQMVSKMAALGRIGEPSEIADVVAFLASSEARWITGQRIQVTGGL